MIELLTMLESLLIKIVKIKVPDKVTVLDKVTEKQKNY